MTLTRRTVLTLVCALMIPLAASAQKGGAEVFVPGYGFHGIHGITFDAQDRLYVGSVVGQRIYRVDPKTGAHEIYEDAPLGMADDLEFGPDGTLVWTSFILGKIHARKEGGEIRELASGLAGINSLAFKQDGRLFATQVFSGDALYEIDINGEKPPRKIIENMGGLNGFDFGPDGLLYGPLWFKGQVARVDVDTGELNVVAEGFKIPAAVNFDSRGRLYVLDTGTGHVVRVDVKTGKQTVVSKFKTAMDNLAFDSKDQLFVTVMAESAIYQINTKNGRARKIKEEPLAMPADIGIFDDGTGEKIYVADTFSLKEVDVATGAVRSLARFAGSELEYPNGIDVSEKYVHQSSWFSSVVQTLDRKTGEIIKTYHDLPTPYDVLELDDGSLLVAQAMAGTLTRITGDGPNDRKVVARGLQMAVSLARAGENAVYVSKYVSGEIIKVNLKTGKKKVVARGLKGPEGIAVDDAGRIIVAETGEARVVRIDPSSGEREVLSADLPIGWVMPPGVPPMGVSTGIVVSKSGAVYVSSDIEDAIYKIVIP